MAGSLSRRLSASDAAFLYFERPHAPLHIGSLGIYDRQIPYERFVAHIESRLPNIPRYRQRIAPVPLELAHPTWEDDPNFNIRNQIHHIQLPPPGTQDQLTILAAELAATPLARTRPLWEMYIVNGVEGNRSAIIAKVHHCMIDGVSGIELLMQTLDVTPEPAPPPPSDGWEPRPLPPSSVRLLDALMDSLEEQRLRSMEFFQRAIDPQRQLNDAQTFLSALRSTVPLTATPAPRTSFNVPLSSQRRVATAQMSFAELREIRTTLGGTVNDVVLAVVAGTLRSYLRAHGYPTDGLELRAAIPVNVRLEDEKGAMGNRVSAIFIELPVHEANPLQRLETIKQRMEQAKAGNQAGAFELLLRTASMTPVPLQALTGLTASNTSINLICTNVPGPMIPLYCVGHQLIDHYPLVPISLNMGLACGVTSYNQKLYFGLMVDPNAVPDYRDLSRYLDETFLELRGAAGVEESDLPVFTGQLNQLFSVAASTKPAG